MRKAQKRKFLHNQRLKQAQQEKLERKWKDRIRKLAALRRRIFKWRKEKKSIKNISQNRPIEPRSTWAEGPCTKPRSVLNNY